MSRKIRTLDSQVNRAGLAARHGPGLPFQMAGSLAVNLGDGWRHKTKVRPAQSDNPVLNPALHAAYPIVSLCSRTLLPLNSALNNGRFGSSEASIHPSDTIASNASINRAKPFSI